MENNLESENKEKISLKLYYSSLYFVTVGIAYLWGYWPDFNINILEYIALTDIIKVTAYPVAVLMGLIIASAAITSIRPATDPSLRVPGQRSSSSSRMINFAYYSLVALWAILILAALSLETWIKWQALPMLLAIPIATSLRRNKVLHGSVKNYHHRITISFIISVMPLAAYGAGKIAADDIIKGAAYKSVSVKFKDLELPIKKEDRLRYIGHAGDHIFLYDPTTQATLISKFDEGNILALKETKNFGLRTMSSSIKKLWESPE